MDLQLADRMVCITGGSRGIGLATARAFAAEGSRVVICGRDQGRLAEAVADVRGATGKEIEAIAADVTRPEQIERLIERIGQRHGRLDILVNNAGTGIYKPFAEVTDAELVEGMAINFFAQFRVTQRALPLLRASEAAAVVNVSGRTALRGNFPPGSSCTGPAKAAEVRFSVDLATELAEDGIRVNCVVRGVVRSPDRFRLWERAALPAETDAGATAAVRDRLEQASVPAGKHWGRPEEIADVIVFLASPRASYVNGAALTVDGGPHTKSYVTQLHAARRGGTAAE